MQSINPYTGEVLKTFEEPSEPELQNALNASLQQFESWRLTKMEQRSAYMHKAGDILKKEVNHWAKFITIEMGKPIKQAEAEIEKCAQLCHYYAEHAEALLQDREHKTEAKASFVSHEPLGPILAIMPWNFPFWQVFRFAVPALMAGNSALLKHASNVPQCALAIEEVFEKAGFPEKLFQSLLISGKRASALMEVPEIKAATLTGSEFAGSQMAQRAGKHLKKTVLELGGSDPFVVLADADLKKAAKNAAHSRLINSGQSCIAAKRFVVEEKVAEEFLSLFKAQLGSYTIGDPMDESIDVGPMAREDLANELREQLAKSAQAGAQVEQLVDPPNGNKAFMPIQLISSIPSGCPADQEELFGPVASLFVVPDAQAAIAKANDTPYGLGASLWTQDPEKARCYSRELQAGCVFVNQFVKSDQRVPFGGIKQSGYGRELSDLGIKEFVNQKTIWIEE